MSDGRVAGCVVTSSDAPLVVTSIACFGAFIAFGASMAALGPAVPELSSALNVSKTSVGLLFTVRGLGYIAGTFGSGMLYGGTKDLVSISKELLLSIFLVVMGCAIGLLGLISSYTLAVLLTLLSGIGFGVIDTLGNVILPELWGSRMQPWMQALHLFFGVGAMLSPALVGAIGYSWSFIAIFLFSIWPILVIVGYKQLLNQSNENSHRNDIKSEIPERSTDETLSQNTESTEPQSLNKESLPRVPVGLRTLISVFYFIYAGCESGFAGWVAVFSLDVGLTNSTGNAAYLSSIFWAALTIGRIVAVPEAIYFSASLMLRIQLLLSIVGALMFVSVFSLNYSTAAIVSAILGYAYSSIFPLMMTIVGDYGYAMDTLSTTWFMLGATFGEASIPMAIGLAIEAAGPISLPLVVVSCTAMIIALYFIVHIMGDLSKPTTSLKLRLMMRKKISSKKISQISEESESLVRHDSGVTEESTIDDDRVNSSSSNDGENNQELFMGQNNEV